MVKPPKNDFVMSSTFRPMLAAKIGNVDTLHNFPYLCTPKIDGIRCITRLKSQGDLLTQDTFVEGVSRVLKPIPNHHIQRVLGEYNLLGLDGELVTFTDGKMDAYNTVQSKVMSEQGKPEFEFLVFDVVEPVAYWDRMAHLKNDLHFPAYGAVKKLLPTLIPDAAHLMAYEEAMVQAGFEGVMLRAVDGMYKFGRSTTRQEWLLKMKRFEDAEATVIGFEELMRNDNEKTTNALGLAERSDHKANMVPASTLGALVCNGHNGVTFNIGSGFDDATRQQIWDNQEEYMMRTVKYKYQPHGQKDAPRCPIFLGFRNPLDMEELL